MPRTLFLLLGVVSLAGSTQPAPVHAQTSAETLRYAVTYVDVMPSARAQAVTAMRRYRDGSRREQGHVGVELFEQVGQPGHFAIVETWGDQQAFDARANAAGTKQFRDALQPLRVTGYDERPYKTFSVGEVAGRASSDAIHVVTHVDTVGGAQGGGPDLVRKVAEASRREPGCVRYDILQHVMRANHFTVIETWRDRAAFEAHAAAAHTKQYREAMMPVTGSPIDERIYRIVE
jgi:quinol monooxygenase YgiN